MPIPLRRPMVPDVAFSANGISTFRLPKGQPHKKMYLIINGTVTLTAAGGAVRPRGIPIRQVQLVTDNGVTPHTMLGKDLLVLAELMEQSPIAMMYTPPGSAAIGSYAFYVALPIMFYEPRAGANAEFYTQLPSWSYTGDVLLRITWGDVTEMFTGAPVGTFTAGSVATAVLVSSDKLGEDAGSPDYTSRFWQTYQSYQQAAVVAGGTFSFDLPRTEDTRQLLLVTEDTNGNYAANIIGTVTLEENNAVQRVANVPFGAISIETAQLYGVTPVGGVGSIDFADDMDVGNIAPSRQYDQFQIRGNVLANGTVRVCSRRIGAPKR